MEIFLTGATGFIGRALAVRLAEAGHAVRALARPGSGASRLDPRIERITGQLDGETLLAPVLARADAIIHLAGRVTAFSTRGFNAVNEDLTKTLVHAAGKHGPGHQAFLHVSSQAALGPCAAPPGGRESDRPAPVSQYGLSKLLGERAALSLAPGRPVAVIRPPMVYGPGDTAFVPLYRLMARGLLTVPGPASQPFSIIHVDDLARGLLLALEALRDGRAVSGSIFHLAGPAPSDWTAYAEAFGRALDRRVRLLHTPWPLLGLAAWGNALLHALGLPTSHLTPDKGREARQEGWLLDDAKARRELGYRPRVALPQGAAGSIAWCQAEGLL